MAERIIEKIPEVGNAHQPSPAALWAIEALFATAGEPVSPEVVAEMTVTWTGRDNKKRTNLVTAVSASSAEYLPMFAGMRSDLEF